MFIIETIAKLAYARSDLRHRCKRQYYVLGHGNAYLVELNAFFSSALHVRMSEGTQYAY